MSKRKVWIFYGGPSHEREVSISTSKGVYGALKNSYDVELFDLSPGKPFIDLPLTKNKPDIVFLAYHGTFGEDGSIQGFLESVKIPFVGCGSFSSAICFHKTMTKRVLEEKGIKTPKAHNLDSQSEVGEFLTNLNKQFFDSKYYIKASRQGSTIGTYRFDPSQFSDPEVEFRSIVEKALSFDSSILIEDWIEGRELTVALLNGKAMPIVEICPHGKFFDYESKYTKGKTEYIVPAQLDEALTRKIQSSAERVFESLECQDYGRVDYMLDGNDFYVLEMNTLPGLTETSLVPKAAQAQGFSYESFLVELISSSYNRQTGDTF